METQIRDKILDQTTREQMWHTAQMKAWNQIKDQVKHKPFDFIHEQIWLMIWDQVGGQVENQAKNQVRNQIQKD